MARIEVLQVLTSNALADLLATLDAATVDNLQEKLLTSTSTPSSELQSVQKLAELLPTTVNAELQTQFLSLTRLVKALCRLTIKYVGVITADPDNVKALLALDDNLLPILRVLKTFVARLGDQDLDEAVYSDKGLLQWLPFVLASCSFVESGELPGADLMQSVVVVGDVLDECSALLKLDRGSVLAKYVGQIVALCSQDVDKEQWVSANSINKKIMLRVVEQVPFPHLGGDLLGRLLALTFPLVDDLTDATQLVGARLLRHIVHNVTPTELRWYSDVLMEVLHTAIVTRKPATLDTLLDCLVESLDKVSPPGELKHYERFVPRLLSDTSLCSEVAVRVVFVRHLRVIVGRLGAPHSLAVIRYLQPLLKVLIAGFESINIELLVETLESLHGTILAAWPRIAPHTEQILVGVLRAVAFCELFEAVGKTQSSHRSAIA
ncbi:hypothetical protein BBO99_00003263 [Phytophthora kernoviae]|uniref:Uncharacterized protein n=2 Tax=Phytophthora kernoviae TaxID=325452 RepID=A0A421GUU6_9STRA|nr:hypothetical protein G195_004830 [Phytophthora kernoviae 00238/432]KAG2525959.1 hypothetical protein JM16_004151 [Phytophthora kernoviae]KAG2527651.1 hypothetical protein JM18_003625 [Phytophthora kernoviae]RLN81930.1 hypothetical protein BBO99_00003263 [Phytophthora kernoviae]